MKNKKSLLFTILAVIIVISGFIYRKYHKAQLKAEQEKIQAERAAKLMEFKRQQDSIKRKREYDSLQQEKLNEFNKKYDEVKESKKRLDETMEKLQQEIDAKEKEKN